MTLSPWQRTSQSPGVLSIKGAMKKWLFVAAINGALAVIAGALASHAQRLDPVAHAYSGVAASYQLSHAIALALAAFGGRGRAAKCATISAALFLVGIVLY